MVFLGRVAAVALACATAAACGPGPGKAGRGDGVLGGLPPVGDAPYLPEEDQDLEQLRAQFDALPGSATDRNERRRVLADEYARRIDHALRRGIDPEAAHENLLLLAGLWTADELASRDGHADLARYAPQAQRVRDHFARAGGDREASAALFLLRRMQPARTEAIDKELDEIFAYADSLAIAQYGPGAERARPIEILESAVDAIRSPYVVDKLRTLYLERQKAIESQFRRSGADFATIRAHGEGVLLTTRRLIELHVITDTIDGAPASIETVAGIGDDPGLRARLGEALAADAGAGDWIALGRAYRSDDEKDQPEVALAIAEIATRRMPASPAIHCWAGDAADDAGNIYLAIRHLERCLALNVDNRAATDQLAGLYEARIGTLIFGDRPRAALEELAKLEQFHRRAAERWPTKPLDHTLSSALATVGRGLVSLGELEGAEKYLLRSIELEPGFAALESLGTVALKQDEFAEAIRFFELALRLPGNGLGAQFQRAKLMRLIAEAHTGAGDQARASKFAEAALVAWAAVSRHGRLVDRFQGELHVEVGKLMWQLGRTSDALREFDAAVDADPNGSSTLSAVVAFLIVRNQPERALDAYHRALGSFEISDYFKVYMSLWVIADARRRGIEPDRLAVEFLAGRRNGRLWYDRLAAYATGRSGLEPLRKRATTRARRAELLYYAAVLGETDGDPTRTRRLLEQVVATDMVLFFEYDMAKLWLERGLTAERDTSSAR